MPYLHRKTSMSKESDFQIANDLQNLQDMVNSDLSNIKKWSEDWLITFNPDKTDIMLFNS
jgi:hypothetical protein